VVVKWGDDGVPGVNGSRGEAKAISVPQALWVAAVWGVIGELGVWVCGCILNVCRFRTRKFAPSNIETVEKSKRKVK
jgi:hypothetical protein